MKKEIKTLTFLYLILLLLLAVSSAFDGILKTVIYIIAFILPITVGIWFSVKEKNGNGNRLSEYLGIEKKDALITAILAPSVILIILTVSLLTSLLISVTLGKESDTVISEGPLLALLIHALLPALLEEGAFRLLPMVLLGDRSPRLTVLLSAFFFALLHTSLFSIPYAFLAGVIFMSLDVATRSVLPSLILHLINNIAALASLGALGFTVELPILFGVFIGATALTLPFLIIKKRELARLAGRAFSLGESCELTAAPLLFAVPTLFIAITEVLI